MRVGYGVTALHAALRGGGIDGIGSYTREFQQRLAARADIELVPYEFHRDPRAVAEGTRPAGGFRSQALPALFAGRQFAATRRALTDVDLVHAPDHMIPRLRDVPVLATLMDAIPLARPDWVGYRFRGLKHRLWVRSAHWADHVVTISEHARDDIVKHFRLDPERVSVVPLGVDERWFAVPAAETRERVRERHDLPPAYFLFIGTIQPRKNLEMLVRAFSALPAALRRECPLLIAGRYGWCCPELRDRLEADAIPDVRWLRHVPDADLPALLHGARTLLFPSLYEGFGLPVLEAFAARVPVLAADATSIPEVAGDAALLIDPYDRTAWSEALAAVAAGNDSHLRAQVDRGHVRARAMTWDAAAERLAAIYGQISA